MPYNERIFRALEDTGVPRTYLAVGAGHLYPVLGELSCEAFSVDWRTPLNEVRQTIGGSYAMQGSLDPAALLGSRESIAAEVERVMRAGLVGAHVFNLGHGMMPIADPDDVAFAIECARGFDRRAEG